MKKFIAPVIFCLAISVSAFAQSRFPEIEKIRQIKLLESTREDVKRIFGDYPFAQIDFIPADRATISISYSKGNCSEEDEIWNVPKDKVTAIKVNLRIPVYPQNLRIDLANLTKEKRYSNRANVFVYHNKVEGIAYEVYKDNITDIELIPSKENYSLLCDKQSVRKYYSSKSWFPDKLKERPDLDRGHRRPFANITDLTLSSGEITIGCATDYLSQTKSCFEEAKIAVKTKGSSYDPTDVITYHYEVSGGQIIGRGANVTWDLSDVKPGIYTIAAGADNGCGVCGRTMTKTVVVKECSDCKQKPK